MNKLTFKILPSKESYDHQVRIEIDGNDYIGDFLGIDPPHFFYQKALFEEGKLLIGRCNCGCEGCFDTIADVEIDEAKIIWRIDNSTKFEFDKLEYTQYINEQKSDFTWEDLNRRVERLVSVQFKGTTIYSHYSFDWASCRIEKNNVVLSFSKKGKPEDYKQELLKFKWNGTDEQNALNRANDFMNKSKIFKKKIP